METAILHRIKAHLYDNVLTADNANDFIARVASERALGVRDICNAAASRGGADVSAATMEHAVNLWFKEMAYQLCDGFSVNTGYFTSSVHIKGVFNSPNEHFDPEKHTVLFEFQQGAALRRELPSVTVDILGVAESATLILQVTDVKTASVNDLLTPNRNLRIAGHKLKIAGENPAVGILFRSTDNADATFPVPPDDIVTNRPSELVIVIPALAAGSYRLEITTQYTGSVLLKEPRTVVFDRTLTVQ
jgi:hypothetical protein